MNVKFLLVMALAVIVCSAQASTISGNSKILAGGEAGFDLQMTFTSDVMTDQITSADFNMGTGGGAMQGPSMNFICPVGGSSHIGTPPGLPSGFPGVQTFTIGYSGLGPEEISHYCEGAEVAAPGATVTVHINGNCPLTGTFTDTTYGHIATFEGTCEGTPPDYDLSPNPVVLNVCQDGGTAQGTFTFTSHYPAAVDVGVMDIYDFNDPLSYPNDLPGIPELWLNQFGIGTLDNGDSGTLTVYSTAKDTNGVVWDKGTYIVGLGISVDDAQTNENFANPSELVQINIVDCQDSPEFPSFFLPVTMIIGFLGVVVLIQRTRES